MHARVQIEPGWPVICICHVLSLPGNPALVRLHPKKNFRDLYGGNLHIGAKLERAEKDDLVPTTISQPESAVWLVQPQQALPAGEYALMLGTQNLSILPWLPRVPRRQLQTSIDPDLAAASGQLTRETIASCTTPLLVFQAKEI